MRFAPLAAIVLIVALTGCSTSIPAAPTSPSKAEAAVTPRSEKITAAVMPEHLYFAGFDDAAQRFDFSPKVGWLFRGESILVTAYGSGSCPERPTSLEIVSATEVTVVFGARPPHQACTADAKPSVTAIALPVDVSGRPLTVSINFSGSKGGTYAHPFTLD